MFDKVLIKLSRSVVYIIKILIWFNIHLLKQPENINKHKFKALAPIDTADDGEGYSDAIEWGIRNNDIKNIALSGPYGSGKSSVIKTFEKNHPEFNLLKISLANFNRQVDDNVKADTAKSNDSKTDEVNITSKIEGALLQQILYQVNDSKIPNSKIKKIKHHKKYKTVIEVFSMMIFVSLISIVLFPANEYIQTLSNKLNIYSSFKSSIDEYSVYLLLILSIFYMYKILNRIKSFDLKSIKSSVGEISIHTDSILNKHLDEILYFFKCCDYDVVVIEDLDRFNDEKIFSKLREINIIINTTQQISKKITFLYAIQDSFFTGEARTKFFDFIIPVIPAVNISNSVQVMKDRLKEIDSNEHISEDLLSNVSLFIDSMRLVNNIFNEFVIYENKLNKININKNERLAFIIYKNILPNDFSMLHYNKGIVANIFLKKEKHILNSVIGIENEIDIHQERLMEIKKYYLKSGEELRSIYIYNLIKRLPRISFVRLNDKTNCDIQNLSQENNFNKFSSTPNIIFSVQANENGGYQNSNLPFSVIEDYVDPEYTYNERIKELESILNNEKSVINSKITDLNEYKSKLKHMKLKELLVLNKDYDMYGDIEIKEEKKGLITYLVSNGYINEMYHSLVTYFYEGDMSTRDMNFVYSIKNRNILPIDYSLDNCKNISNWISPLECRNIETLNQDFIEHLIDNLPDTQDKFDSFISQFDKLNNEKLEFILYFTKNSINFGELIKGVFTRSDLTWGYIILQGNLDDYEIKKLLEYMINYTDIQHVIDQDDLNILSDYISSMDEFNKFLAVSNLDVSKVQKILLQLDVKFKNIDTDKEVDILRFIYINNLYVLNKFNFNKLLSSKYIMKDAIQYSSVNYLNALYSLDDEPIVKYLNLNINEFVANIYLNTKEEIKEENGEVILELLNNDNLSNDSRASIIERVDFKLSDPTLLHTYKSIMNKLLELNKVEANWNNVFISINDSDGTEISEELIGFINNEENYSTLVANKEFDECFDGSINLFIEAIFQSNKVSNDAFAEILTLFPQYIDNIKLVLLSTEKLSIVISKNALSFTQNNINKLLEFDDKSLMDFLIKNTEAIILDFEAYSIPDNFKRSLLSIEELSTNEKYNLLLVFSDLDFSIEKSYEDVAKIIIDSKNIIQNEHEEIISKIILINQIVLSDDIIITILKLLGANYSSLFDGKQPIFDLNEKTVEMAMMLESRDLISSYKTDDNKLRMYGKRLG